MWTTDDISWLQSAYPQLKLIEPTKISGELSFSMLRQNGGYVVEPSREQVDDKNSPDYLHIADTYKVDVTWPEGKEYPVAHEMGGRLAEVARQKNKSLLDMHQYEENKALCLATPMDLKAVFRGGFTLEAFVQDLLVPYLFAQSHYAQADEWLWGEHSHGYLGLIEWLGRHPDPSEQNVAETYQSVLYHGPKNEVEALLSKRCRGHLPCACGSKLKVRDCHPDLQRGVSLLRSYVQQRT